MKEFVRRILALYHHHPVEITTVFISIAVVLALQVGRKTEMETWPQQWEFHQRIQLGRFNHGQREVLYWHPHGNWVHMPDIGAAAKHLRDHDSISKNANDKRLFLIRDSICYRFTSQYAWNQTARDFEFAGRDSAKL